MTNLNFLRWLPLGGAALLSLAAPLPAHAEGDSVYRCSVLGDRQGCETRAAPSADSGVRLVPGAYARYLIHQGRSFDEAIELARAAGEQPTLRVVRHEPRPVLGGFEAYERHHGRAPALDGRQAVDLAGSAAPVAR